MSKNIKACLITLIIAVTFCAIMYLVTRNDIVAYVAGALLCAFVIFFIFIVVRELLD